MSDLLAFVIVSGFGLLLLPRLVRGERAEVRGLAVLSLFAHLAAAAAQVWITAEVYGGGDMLMYHRIGIEIARLLDHNFAFFAPEVLEIVFQQQGMLPFPVLGTGNSTGTMAAVSGFLVFFLGRSLYGIVALVAVIAFYGKLALHRALAADASDEMRVPLFAGVMLVPSVVYWSAGLLKESLVIGALGFMYVALRNLVIERRVSGAFGIALAGTAVALVKPYILFAFVVGMGALLYGEHARRDGRLATIRPLSLAFAAALAVVGMIALGELFPQFAPDQLAESAAHQQAVGARIRGGSSYSLGDPEARSLTGQLAFAPIAIVSSLFRPFVFEARNALTFLNAIEATALMLLTVRALVRRSWAAMWRDVLGSPMLMFCLAFVLALALPVGLATTNLGTLSRYRMPLVPFFAAVLMIWNSDLFQVAADRERLVASGRSR